MGKMLSTRNVQVSPSVGKKLGKRWLYYNYWIVIFSSVALLSNTEKVGLEPTLDFTFNIVCFNIWYCCHVRDPDSDLRMILTEEKCH